MTNIGIPVSVGIAPTKTLAKMANRYAKKKCKDAGVYYARDRDAVDTILNFTAVGDIWGIGARYASLLRSNGFSTAKDVTKIPGEWMRANMSVVGLRTWNDLNGIRSIALETEIKAKKNICTSRSFGQLTSDYDFVKEAASNYAATCARKLREQHSVCKAVNFFIQTNPHKKEHKQYAHSITMQCDTSTNLTKEIIGYALKGLEIIFLPGDYLYMKCGVMLLDIMPQSAVQMNMFDNIQRSKDKLISGVVDDVNHDMGDGTVRMAVQRFEKRYKLRTGYLSKKYTTNINEILKVKI
jgi:DNA polymerase V